MNLRVLIDSYRDPIWSVDASGHLLLGNKAFQKLLSLVGVQIPIPGEDILQYLEPEKRTGWTQIHTRALSGESFCFENHYEINGQALDLEISASPVVDQDGKVMGVSYFGRDVTDPNRDQRSIKAAEFKYRKLLDTANESILVCDWETGDILDANHKAADMLGYSLNEFQGVKISRFHPPDLFPSYYRSVGDQLAEHGVAFESMIMLRKDGHHFPVELSASSIDLDGRQVVQGVLRDVTARQQSETALRESEEKDRALADAAHDSIFVINRDDQVSYVNRYAAQQWGCQPEDVMGKPRSSLFPPDVNTEQKYWLDRIFETGEPVHRESRGAFPKGERWLDSSLVPLKNPSGEVTAVLGVSRDITERKQMEDELRESQQQYRITIDSMGDGIHVVDQDLRVVLVNKAMTRWMKELGLSSDMMGKSIFEIFPFLIPRVRGEYHDDFSSGKTLLTEENTTVGDKPILTETRKIPVFKDNKVIRVITVIRDITDRKQTESALRQSEEQLRQSQKMEAIGRLAGGVAHDFNNLLTSILGFSHLALDELQEGHPSASDIREVIQGAERAAKLTQQLLAMGRRQMLQIVPLDLNTVVVNMEQLLRRTLGEDLELVIFLGDELGSVEADAGYLEQVILNLAVNARDAMTQGGVLSIQTLKAQFGDSKVHLPGGIQPGEYVMLMVRDTGSGMTSEVMEHAFEPFYTTKEHGKGTGLGLTMVYGIVKQCHGHIELESPAPVRPDLHLSGSNAGHPGRGTEVRIYFPSVQSPSEKPVQLDELYVPRGNESILVVEDEDAVRRFTVRILQGLGYHVMEARHAMEATTVCQDRNVRIDMILSDVVMPQISGPEMIRHVRTFRQDFKVLFATGFTQDTIVQHGLSEEGGDAVILKPFTREALAAKIRQVLDAD
ncbi:MAG: PAS domain S-box protein [Lentisphaerota bacterium]